MIIYVWICSPTVSRVLHKACTISDWCGKHHKLLPMVSFVTTPQTCSCVILVFWSSLKSASTPGNAVVSGYASTIYQECGEMHGPCLITGLYSITHNITCNHTQDILQHHTDFLNNLKTIHTSWYEVVQGGWCRSGYTILPLQGC